MLGWLCRRFPWLTTPVTVQERVSAVGGGPLAAAVTLAGFLSLFPLLLLAIAVLGFVSAGDVDFAGEAVERLGLQGRAAEQVLDTIHTAEDSRAVASVVGLVGLAWSGLRVVDALEAALNATWQTTGRGLTGKLVGAGWLVGAGLLFLATLALTPALAVLPGPAAVATALAGVVVDTVLFLWMFRTLTNVAVPWRAHLPGAVAGGLGLEVLKLIGGVYLPRTVASASALYGSLGVVFGILAWLALSARLVVYASALNVVRYEGAHGTVRVDIEVPRIAGTVPLEANRGGAVAETLSPDQFRPDAPGQEGDMAASETRTTTDHDEIRRWAEDHGGKPTLVRGTEDGGGGVLRIDFPGGAGEQDLEPVDWDQWFATFEDRQLALLYQERKADGSDSTFHKLVRR